MTSPRPSALRTLDTLIALGEQNLSTLQARGQDPAFKLDELAALRARRAELAAR